jgi:hypothetical protein
MSWLGKAIAVARQAPATTTGARIVIANNHHTSSEPEWGSIVGAEFSARAYFWIGLRLDLASGNHAARPP